MDPLAIAGFLLAGGGLTALGTVIGAVVAAKLKTSADRATRVQEYELSVIDDTRRQALDAIDFMQAYDRGDGPGMANAMERISGAVYYRRGDLLMLGDHRLFERMATKMADVANRGFGHGKSAEDYAEWGKLTADVRGALREQERRVVSGEKPLEIRADTREAMEASRRIQTAYDRMAAAAARDVPEPSTPPSVSDS